MPLFRGSKNATTVNGEIVATAQDISDAVNDAIAAKNAAEVAEAAALSTLDYFDDRYLGAKTSDPSTDNDGDALIDGALYYNTDTSITRVYDVSSSQWFNVKPTATEQKNINTVSGISVDVEAVADISSDVSTTAGSISDIQTVASDLNETVSEIDTVASNIDDVNNVGNNIADVITVAGISTDVTAVVDDEQDIGNVSSNISSVGVVASDLAGAGFDYDLGNITQATEGVVGTPDGYIITVFNIRDDITTVAANVSDVTNFADVYIGPASSDPTTRSDGSALQNGDLYFNTTDDRLKVYDSTQWEVTARGDSDIKSLFSASGDLSYDSAAGEFYVTTYKSSDFDTDLSSKSTSDLSEGTNLYYTDARVNADIDARVDKTFVDTLNVDSDTLDGQEGTYYLDRANHTGTQTLSTVSDSGDLAALNTVDTAQIANQAVTDDKLAATLDLGSI